jgi:subtilisin family serine protease
VAAVTESYWTDPLTLAAKQLVDAGVVVVTAAGNMGSNAAGQSQYGGIGAPGNAPWVLTVGASSHMGTADRSDDLMAAFSSRGPSAVDYGAKPDLVAPGVGIESLSNPNSAMYTSHSAYLLDGTVATPYLPYLSLSGTSMAAPVVAGTVALMLQANPALTPNAVKAILQYSSQPYDQYDALTQGAGFLNAKGAVTLAQYFAAPNAVYPSSDGWGTRLIWGNQLVQAGRLRGDVNAWAVDVVWGAATTASGQTIEWGVTCSTGDCDSTGAWQPWVASGSDDGQSHNVVWGSSCGGADCHRAWTTSDDEGVVWGTGDDSEGVVWGTNCADADSSCESVTWSNQ